jgi:hypothetical protein
MISALIPSRNRPDGLIHAVESLRSNASRASNVEILVAIDMDDEETLKVSSLIAPCKIYVCERYGYKRLHEYYNTLANLAQGGWLLLFNDDAECVTKLWDTNVEAHDETIPRYLCGTTNHSEYPCFPLISRKAYEVMGCFSRHRSNDGFLKEVFERRWPQAMHQIEMHVLHTPVEVVTPREDMGAFLALVEEFAKGLP